MVQIDTKAGRAHLFNPPAASQPFFPSFLPSSIRYPTICLSIFSLHWVCHSINLANRLPLLISLHPPSCM